MPLDTVVRIFIMNPERLKLVRPAACQLFHSKVYIERIDPKWKEKHLVAAASATF